MMREMTTETMDANKRENHLLLMTKGFRLKKATPKTFFFIFICILVVYCCPCHHHHTVMIQPFLFSCWRASLDAYYCERKMMQTRCALVLFISLDMKPWFSVSSFLWSSLKVIKKIPFKTNIQMQSSVSSFKYMQLVYPRLSIDT